MNDKYEQSTVDGKLFGSFGFNVLSTGTEFEITATFCEFKGNLEYLMKTQFLKYSTNSDALLKMDNFPVIVYPTGYRIFGGRFVRVAPNASALVGAGTSDTSNSGENAEWNVYLTDERVEEPGLPAVFFGTSQHFTPNGFIPNQPFGGPFVLDDPAVRQNYLPLAFYLGISDPNDTSVRVRINAVQLDGSNTFSFRSAGTAVGNTDDIPFFLREKLPNPWVPVLAYVNTSILFLCYDTGDPRGPVLAATNDSVRCSLIDADNFNELPGETFVVDSAQGPSLDALEVDGMRYIILAVEQAGGVITLFSYASTSPLGSSFVTSVEVSRFPDDPGRALTLKCWNRRCMVVYTLSNSFQVWARVFNVGIDGSFNSPTDETRISRGTGQFFAWPGNAIQPLDATSSLVLFGYFEQRTPILPDATNSNQGSFYVDVLDISLAGGNTGGGSGNGDGSGDGVSGAALGGIGAAVGVLALVACCAVCCVLICCALLLALLVLLVVVVVVMVVIVIVIAALAGAGGVGAVVLTRKGGGGDGWDVEAKGAGKDRAMSAYLGEDVADGLQREFRELAYADLTFERKIGEGAFGKVFLGFWRDETQVAIKELNVRADEDAKREFVHEANVMVKIGNHPNVVHFLGAVTTEERFYMVTEFAENGSLLDVLARDPDMRKDSKLVDFARDAAVGLTHLHAEGIVHRDIAARNFLVDAHMQVMISDFGLSRVMERQMAAEDSAQRTASTVGPIRWMAPESLRVQEYSLASDSYMFGMFLYELVTGDVPFKELSVQEVLMAIERGERPPLPTRGPPVLLEIIQACWAEDPADRPSIKSIATRLNDESGRKSSRSARKALKKAGDSAPLSLSHSYVDVSEMSGGSAITSNQGYFDTGEIEKMKGKEIAGEDEDD